MPFQSRTLAGHESCLSTSRNGKTSGITQPSIEGQAEVIRKAYHKAGIHAKDTPYVECHGTGTSVGDPMEVEALSKVFPRDRVSPLLLGAVCGHAPFALDMVLTKPTEQDKSRSQRSSQWNLCGDQGRPRFRAQTITRNYWCA